MRVLGNMARFVDDRINPVLVKELRQAVESSFVAVMLQVYLAIEILAIMLAVLFDQSLKTSLNAGEGVFTTLNAILLGTCLLFVPAYAGIRLAAERADQNVDLMFITTVTPGAVIRGKMLTALAMTLLVFSVCAPFMMMTYLLRGIDIPTIAFILATDVAVVAASVAGALLIAALPLRWPMMLLLAIVLLVGMVIVFWLVTVAQSDLIVVGVGSQMGSWNFWAPTLAFLGFIIAGCGLPLFLAQAALAPPASNRARPVRVYATLIWALTGEACVLLTHAYPAPAVFRDFHWPLLQDWAGVSIGALTVGLIIAGCERDEWGLRLRRTIPRSWVMRPLWLVFSSGSLGGLLWTCLMIAGTFAALWCGTQAHRELLPHVIRQMQGDVGLVCTVLAYVLVGTLLRDQVFRRKTKTVLVGALALLLMAAGSLIPMLIAFFQNPNSWQIRRVPWLFLNPMAAMTSNTSGTAAGAIYAVTAAVWCGVMVVLNVPWAARQVRACHPPTPMESMPLASPKSV